jgi:hypothetical protein
VIPPGASAEMASSGSLIVNPFGTSHSSKEAI